jgi:hypothetical protein
MTTRSDLPAEQKNILVKRTRKLERVLGEPLPENTVERVVVEPTMAPTTISTKVQDAPWPRIKRQAEIPEWLREDCVPQRAERPASVASGSSGDPFGGPPAVTTRSKIARVLLGDPAPTLPTDIRVYVRRELHVAETREGELFTQRRTNMLANPAALTPRFKGGAGGTAESSSGGSVNIPSPEETGRRARRSQLSKVRFSSLSLLQQHGAPLSSTTLPSAPFSAYYSFSSPAPATPWRPDNGRHAEQPERQ